MLTKLLCGSLLTKDVYGVDDLRVVDCIRRQCLLRSTILAPVLALSLGAGGCGGGVLLLLTEQLAWGGG